ncbi:hypothetical protein GWI33_011644, partial [Rhynchophorus ferrugineus]
KFFAPVKSAFVFLYANSMPVVRVPSTNVQFEIEIRVVKFEGVESIHQNNNRELIAIDRRLFKSVD